MQVVSGAAAEARYRACVEQPLARVASRPCRAAVLGLVLCQFVGSWGLGPLVVFVLSTRGLVRCACCLPRSWVLAEAVANAPGVRLSLITHLVVFRSGVLGAQSCCSFRSDAFLWLVVRGLAFCYFVGAWGLGLLVVFPLWSCGLAIRVVFAHGLALSPGSLAGFG